MYIFRIQITNNFPEIAMIDLCKIKEDFSVLVKEAQPWTLTQFVMWLDLKLSEFKIKGYMVLGRLSMFMEIYWFCICN